MKKIANLEELKSLEGMPHVWAWTAWDGYSVWQWQGEGLCEMAPTDMADFCRVDRISDDMFPMYVIPEPPAKPETIDSTSTLVDDITRASKTMIEAGPSWGWKAKLAACGPCGAPNCPECGS